ncbi:MAG: hypothetical protein ACP5OA_02490 [Candidatus Woesearchaeota archaeon]
MTLESALNRELEENKGKYTLDTINRVSELIRSISQNPDKRIQYKKHLINVEDYQLFHALHPEWNGKSTHEMHQDKTTGASAFYKAFNRWINTFPAKERKILKENVFPDMREDWSTLNTIDDWKAYFNSHPEWYGKSTEEMQKDKVSGGIKFYHSFNRWMKNFPTTDRKNLKEQIFPVLLNDWSTFKTIDDWKSYFNSRPEWQSKSTHNMIRGNIDGASAFYGAFKKWVNTHPISKRKSLTQQIFPVLLNDWSTFKTIDDWKSCYDSHSEWHGKSTNEIHDDYATGASAFYVSFSKWLKKESKGDEEQRSRLMRCVFQETDNTYSFDGKIAYFDSKPERLVGLVLHKVGLMDDVVENKNLHVKTNEGSAHSIDFLVGNNVFVEYHPVTPFDKDLGRNTIEDIADYKLEHVTNPKFKGYQFHIIDRIDQLYGLFRGENIKPYMTNRYRDMSKEQFDELIKEARLELHSYDKNHMRR